MNKITSSSGLMKFGLMKFGLEKFNDFKFIVEKFPINNLIDKTNTFNIASLVNNAEYYILKPKGRKAYLWFSYYKKDLLCILIFLNNKNLLDESNEFYKFDINYDNTLCYNNVLLSGTYFYKTLNTIKNKKDVKHYFILDNALNYNIYNINNVNNVNNNVTNVNNNNNIFSTFKCRLNLYKNILRYITNTNYNVYLGIILDNYDNIYKLIYKLNYEIYCISCFNNNKYLGNFIINNLNNKLNINNNLKNNLLGVNFKISACLNQDLYNLYVLENNKEVFYDYALIDSYKTSIFMNDLFRRIKENKNLDLLEESDSEEEFENIDLGKYVNLDKYYIIECIYNKKFKKWIPTNLAKNNYIIEKNKINYIMNKNKIYL